MSVNIKEYPFAKVSHSNPRESVFSPVLVWDTALSRGVCPTLIGPRSPQEPHCCGTLWRNYHDEEIVTHSHFFITFAAQKDKGDENQGGN